MPSRAVAITRGVVVQMLARGSGLPLSLVTLGIATRYLGESGYGILTTAVVFVGLFETFTELGVGTVIVRRVTGRAAENLSRLVGMNLALSISYAIPLALVTGIAGWVAYAGRPTAQAAVLVVACGLIFSSIASCLDPIFDVHVRYGAVAAAEFGGRALTVAAAAAVAWADAGLLAMCAVQIVPHLVRLLVAMAAAPRMETLRLVADGRGIWSLVRESLPLTAVLIIGVVYWRADGVLLSLLARPEQVAAYGIAYQLAFSLAMLPQIFSRSALSTINERYAHDHARFRDAVDKGYRFLLLCAAPVAVLGFPLAERVVVAVGSQEFAGGATRVLQLFFVAAALNFLTSVITDAMIAAHEQRYLTALSGLNLTVNILLNVILIPALGAVGCGIALIVSEASGVVFSQPRLRRVGVKLIPLGYLVRLLPALLGALALVLLTEQLPLLVTLLCAGVGYLVLALLLGAIPHWMRRSMRHALLPGQARTQPGVVGERS